MVHIGWDNHLFGARNCGNGEYDACQYSVLAVGLPVYFFVVGLPVYFSFQGCFHVIPESKLKTEERKEQMLMFVQTFLGFQGLAKRILLPLKPKRELKRMWFYEYFLWQSGLTIVPPSLFALVIPAAQAPTFVFSLIVVLSFLSVIVRFLFLRRPSPWQAGIRGVVASRLGPFSDPADWTTELAARVTPVFGIAVPTSEKIIQKAEQLLKQGHYEDALIAARVVLALMDSENDPSPADRAESISELCLRSLAEGY
jgi:hypothetical protein